MEPYDKSDSFIRKITKRVSELIPETTRTRNILLGESQSANDLSLTNESNDQPPVEKLCTSNNTFAIENNQTYRYVDSSPSKSSIDNHENQPNINAVLPGTTWMMNMLLGESQSDLSLTIESNDQPPVKKLCTSNNTFTSANNRTSNKSPSYRWDTYVDYEELSERQKLFALKSPLNCSRVMYGGSSACSNLSRILGSSPPIHKKTTIKISPTNNNEIMTCSSILLGHNSTKNKKNEEFIIQSNSHLRHKAESKILPITVETTIKSIDTVSEKSYNISRDISRKLRDNISKKTQGFKFGEHEMHSKVDLPNITTLPVPILTNINLFNNCEYNEFTFRQPLTIEQFSLKIAEKKSRKQQKIISLRRINSNTESNSKNSLCPTVKSLTKNTSINETEIKEPEKISISNMVENLNNDDKLLKIPKYENDFKNNMSKSLENSSSNCNLEPIKSNDILKLQEFNNTKKEHEKNPVELKKWICNACWIRVLNDSEKNNCVACQTPKSCKSQKTLKIVESSTWTCETCWVRNKNEVNSCVACQTQKPGSSNKVLTQNNTWTCVACWVKNKIECTSCISCGTGIVLENNAKHSTQFKFATNNNTFENSTSRQLKFGFNNDKTNNVTSQFKFVNPTFNNSANDKSGDTADKFKFGMVNNKTDQSFNTFKFCIDNSTSQHEEKIVNVSNNNNTEQSISQFKFGFEKISDQSESQFNFGLNASTNKSISQFKFGSENIVTDKSKLNFESVSKSNTQFKFGSNNAATEKSKQNLESINNISKYTNDLNKNAIRENQVESQRLKNLFKFSDTNVDKLIPQVSLDIIENPLVIDIGQKNNDRKEKIVQNPINFGSSQTVQSTISNPNQLVYGHSHSNENQKPNFLKTSQLFSFGSLAKQDQISLNNQKIHKPFTFGSATNDNPFVTPTINCFPNTGLVFGTNNTMFGNGPTRLPPSTLSLSHSPSQFSFFSFKSITNTAGLTFGAQSPPVFNTGGFIKSVQTDDQSINTSNSIFNPSSSKQINKSTDWRS